MKKNLRRYFKDRCVLNTFKYSNYSFLNESQTKCSAIYFNKSIENKCENNLNITVPGIGTYKEDFSLKDIFKKVLKLGELIYKNLDTIKSKEECLFLYDISDNIVKNVDIKNYLLDIFKSFGIPFKYPLSFASGSAKDINNGLCKNIKNGIEFETIHFINLSLSIYLIYSLKDILVNVKKKKAFNFFIKNQYLNENYNNGLNSLENFIYDKKTIILLKKYMMTCINITQRYIDYYFNISSYYRMEAIDNVEYFFNEFDSDYKEINFINLITYINDPFIASYEYLMRVLPLKNNIQPMYFCDNCGTLISKNVCLCSSCRKQLGKEIIEKSKEKKIKPPKTSEDELEELDNGQIRYNSDIEKIYKDRRNHKKSYYKKISNQ